MCFQAKKDVEMKKKDEEIKRKDDEIKKKDEEIREKEKEIRKKQEKSRNTELIFSIQRKIYLYEKLFAPDLADQQSLNAFAEGTITKRNESLWQTILSRTDDPRINRLNQLLESAKIPRSVFCATVDGFSRIALSYTRESAESLANYYPSDIESILKRHFDIGDSMTINCVTQVLYKL